MECPTGFGFERLVDLADMKLGGEEAAAVQEHLRSCQPCAEDASWLRRVIGLMRSDPELVAEGMPDRSPSVPA